MSDDLRMPWHIKVSIGAALFSALCSGTLTAYYIWEMLRR